MGLPVCRLKLRKLLSLRVHTSKWQNLDQLRIIPDVVGCYDLGCLLDRSVEGKTPVSRT